jgi:ABC-type glycerol-3-phosphate transport system permease component
MATPAIRVRTRRPIDWGYLGTLLFLTALGAVMALPIAWLVSSSFKPLDEFFLFPPRFFVRNPTLNNFRDLLLVTSGTWVPFGRFVLNSVVVTVASVGGSVVIAIMAAYPLAKYRAMPGRNFLFLLIVSALMFSPEVAQIPRYMVVNGLGMMDRFSALIVPNLAAALGLFLLKQFLEQVPDTLLEAARIDGASEWQILWRVIWPLATPAWSTVGILQFIAFWNDSWSPMVFTRSESMKTLPLAILTISPGPGQVAFAGAETAASMLQFLPVVLIFALLQRRVIQTMVHSGIKG